MPRRAGFLLLSLLPFWPWPATPAMPAEAAVLFTVDDPVLDEISGLARSQRVPNLFWAHNDSGGEPVIYAVDGEGRHVGSVRLAGAMNIDWEDIASFTRGGESWLLVGDTGDNFAWRSSITLYLLREPMLPVTTPVPAPGEERVVPVATRYDLRWPDGARDVEALAVDAETHMAYLVSKRDARPALYRFDLDSETAEDRPGTLEALGPIAIPRAALTCRCNVNSFNWVTAMDFSDNGRTAYVGTLTQGYRYARLPGQSWPDALRQPPVATVLPVFPQIEAGTFVAGRDDVVYIASEQLPARMARLPLRGALNPPGSDAKTPFTVAPADALPEQQ